MPANFRINSPNVVHETIDGEVVIINLEKGDYYSLVKTGANIWSGIERGLYQENLIAEVMLQYEGDRLEIENAINTFITKLQQEELIVTDTTEVTDLPDAQTVNNVNKQKLEFEPPILEKYTDMQDLLLLDPIHDVDEDGWPNVKEEVA